MREDGGSRGGGDAEQTRIPHSDAGNLQAQKQKQKPSKFPMFDGSSFKSFTIAKVGLWSVKENGSAAPLRYRLPVERGSN